MLIQPFLLYYVNQVVVTLTGVFKQNLQKKKKEVCIKIRRHLQWPPVSLTWRLDREMGRRLILHETGFTR